MCQEISIVCSYTSKFSLPIVSYIFTEVQPRLILLEKTDMVSRGKACSSIYSTLERSCTDRAQRTFRSDILTIRSGRTNMAIEGILITRVVIIKPFEFGGTFDLNTVSWKAV